MVNKETTQAPQRTISTDEYATRRLKQAHGRLMEVQEDINKAEALLTPEGTWTLPLEELHKLSCQLHHLLASMDRSLSAASFFCEEAVFSTDLSLRERKRQEEKRPYMKPAVGASPRLQLNLDKVPL